MSLADYQLFVAIVEAGSITSAARALGVSRPTLSRRLSALEERLGLALLHRSTRRIAPTAAGQKLFERMRPLLADVARVEALVAEERDEVTGRLRVSVPPVIAPEVARVLVGLQRTHPRLAVDLQADIRWADLRSDRVDVALRAGRVEDPDLVQRRIGVADVSAVAAPEYLARRGVPEDVAALAGHALLRGQSPDGSAQTSWPLRDGGRVGVDGGFVTNDQLSLREAALAGAGIALLSEVSSAAAIGDGRLARVLPERVGTRLRLHAVFARRTLQPARVRVFVDALVHWFEVREAPFGLV